jgi:hypothetical protein
MSNWDVGIVSVVDLNIGWRWGESMASARSTSRGHIRLRWRRQFDSDILIPDVWVK